LRDGKPRLRRRGPNAPERLADGQATGTEPSREVERLVESAGAPSRRMKGNRDEAVRVLEQPRAPAPHQGGQRFRQRSPPFIFQRVDDGAKRAVVGAGRERPCDEAPSAAASRAAGHRPADDTPRRQRVAAALAERGSQRPHRVPADVANGPARRSSEDLAAGGAGRRENDREDRIAELERPSTRTTVREESRRVRRCPRDARGRRTSGCPGRTRAR